MIASGELLDVSCLTCDPRLTSGTGNWWLVNCTCSPLPAPLQEKSTFLPSIRRRGCNVSDGGIFIGVAHLCDSNWTKRERGSHFVLTLKKKTKTLAAIQHEENHYFDLYQLVFLNKQIRFLDSLFNANSHRCTRHCARKHTMQLKMCFPRVRSNMWSRRLNHQPCDWFHDWLYHQLPYTS